MQFQERFIQLLDNENFNPDDIQYLLNALNPDVLGNGHLFTDNQIIERAKLEIDLWIPLYKNLANYVIAHDNFVRLGLY